MTRAPFVDLDRDDAVAEGRAKGGGTTYYSVPGVMFNSVTTLGVTAGNDFYAPWFARTPVVVDQLAFEVVTLQAGNARVGFYRADRDWQPFGAPVADSGDISTGSTGVKTYTPSTPIIVRPGRYLSVINTDAGPTVRIIRGSFAAAVQSGMGTNSFLSQMTASRAYAEFPTPGTAWTAEGGSATGGALHNVFYRIVRP